LKLELIARLPSAVPPVVTEVDEEGGGIPCTARLLPTARAVPSAAPALLLSPGCWADSGLLVTKELPPVAVRLRTPDAWEPAEEFTAIAPAVTLSSWSFVSSFGLPARAKKGVMIKVAAVARLITLLVSAVIIASQAFNKISVTLSLNTNYIKVVVKS
jgi:hypothetical protein